MSFDFQQLANFSLARGSHKQPSKGGNICVNEAAVIAAGFQYREIRMSLAFRTASPVRCPNMPFTSTIS
jgi:hypothetical protein